MAARACRAFPRSRRRGRARATANGHDEHEPAAAGSRAAEIVTSGFLVISAILSWVAFLTVGFGEDAAERVQVFNWFSSGTLSVDWAFRIDTLTVVMLVVVTTVSSLVHIYSIGYMAHDPYRPRFFAYLSIFTFAMLTLVTADNLVQLFFGWEGVGLASYLLIGFWYKRPSANAAAIKAFIVNRVGDFGFALGIFAIFVLFNSVEFETIFANAPTIVGTDDALPVVGSRRADRDLPAPFHGGDGQVGAVPAPHLAARRHGRSDAGLGPHPCRDHGDRRRLHGGAPVAAVRAVADGARPS